MILADKIIEERKKLGLSQEELADKLSVSRQAVSKWESAQSIPDLEKIVTMSKLFSVSTDYLLKDDIEPEKSINVDSDYDAKVRVVSIEEANKYMSIEERESKNVAFGVMLCILSPVLLIFLNGLATKNIVGITENIACIIGLSILFIFIAIAVFIFIRYSSKVEGFNYLEKDEFETAYGVAGLVKDKKTKYEPTYIKYLSLGVILCILSPVPLIISALIEDNDVLAISMTALLLVMAAIGVYMIVHVALIKSSYQILLQEDEYNKTEKKKNKATEKVGAIYWSLVTAAYLAWSFITFDWNSTWIIWPIAGVLFAPFSIIVKSLCKPESN